MDLWDFCGCRFFFVESHLRFDIFSGRWGGVESNLHHVLGASGISALAQDASHK